MMGVLPKLLGLLVLLHVLTNSAFAQSYGSFVDKPRAQRSQGVDSPRYQSTNGAAIRNNMPASIVNLHRGLNQRLAALRIDRVAGELSLAELVQQLNALGVPTALDVTALEDENLEYDEIMHIPSAPMSLGEGITLALEPLHCGWTIKKNGSVVLISTDSVIEEELLTVTYDVTPIVRGNDFYALINAVTSTIEPDDWDDVGGPCTVQPIDVRARRMLIVSAGFHVQLQTQQLLDSLVRMGGKGAWTAPVPSNYVANTDGYSVAGSSVIAAPRRPEKRGISLPNSKRGSTSGFGGGMGGMGGGMAGGMF